MLSPTVRLYYYAKHLIPRRLQIALRRQLQVRKGEKFGNTWPTYRLAETLPREWAGWPEDKKFALVLTHDVDTKAGYDKCLELADLEERLGFRSVFNFVASEYEVSPQLREELRRRGFEVGIHGLYHNSFLYHSREEFQKQAPLINQVLKDWNAVGFRSPCMYHNLDWIHDLQIEYDASTFDMDPFEPQPDGMHTLFPIHVRNGLDNRAYVELPYTLPQDFTLFVLMRNRTIDIWKKKLEWIVGNGGMALMITHPDYMCFGGKKPTYSEYDVELYRQFLEHIRTAYKDQYWHVLPCEIARFWVGFAGGKPENGCSDPGIAPGLRSEPPSIQRGDSKNVCMMAYTFYEEDNRVRRYAEALAKRGDRVDVIALQRGGLPSREVIRGVNVYRIQARVRNERGKSSYLSRVLKFLVNSAVFISRKHIASKYDLVHVHSVPDFEVFAALLPKVSGAKIILDIHDIVPEFYASKFNVKPTSPVYKALVLLEKLSIWFSDHVIISNHLWEQKLIARSVSRGKCSTYLNYPDPAIFNRQAGPLGGDNKFLIMYPGSLNWHQGLDIAVKAFAVASRELGNAEFHIYGEGPEESALRTLVADLGLENKILFKGSLPLDTISSVMAKASVGVVPKRNDNFGGEAFSTKIFEFMSVGVPVILSKTRIDAYYFNDSVVRFFEPENYRDLAESLVYLAANEDARHRLASNALGFVNDFCWDKKSCDYFGLIGNMCG